jgi:hypothetical protein
MADVSLDGRLSDPGAVAVTTKNHCVPFVAVLLKLVPVGVPTVVKGPPLVEDRFTA